MFQRFVVDGRNPEGVILISQRSKKNPLLNPEGVEYIAFSKPDIKRMATAFGSQKMSNDYVKSRFIFSF
jgi:hypothetical protein